MSDYEVGKRKRNQTLLIVEGHHEKERLFWLLFRAFPEMNINKDDIWIYGTNIYQLYEDIAREYGMEWAETETDVDLPFVVSRKQKMSKLRYKTDFTNIILVFDYERQDPYFSEKKIQDMQRSFSDMTDMGQLYINYPMLESYLHLKSLPDVSYLEKKASASMKVGGEYKKTVNEESGIKYTFEFPHKLHESLMLRFKTKDDNLCDKYCDDIYSISDSSDIVNQLREILEDSIVKDNKDKLEGFFYGLSNRIRKAGFAYNGENYWEHVRNLFKEIIYHNIWKANYIQGTQNEIKECLKESSFEQLDLIKILQIQNACSHDVETGIIWVLNTCVFVVAEYNFKLVSMIA